MVREFEGLSELEIIQLMGKKKKRYIAIGLSDLEELIVDEDTFKKVRKVFLDTINGYTRGLYSVLNIDVDGIEG